LSLAVAVVALLKVQPVGGAEAVVVRVVIAVPSPAKTRVAVRAQKEL